MLEGDPVSLINEPSLEGYRRETLVTGLAGVIGSRAAHVSGTEKGGSTDKSHSGRHNEKVFNLAPATPAGDSSWRLLVSLFSMKGSA